MPTGVQREKPAVEEYLQAGEIRLGIFLEKEFRFIGWDSKRIAKTLPDEKCIVAVQKTERNDFFHSKTFAYEELMKNLENGQIPKQILDAIVKRNKDERERQIANSKPVLVKPA